MDVFACSFAPFVCPSLRADFERAIVSFSDLPGFKPLKDLLPAATDLVFFLTFASTLSATLPLHAVFAADRHLTVTTADLPLTTFSDATLAMATAAGFTGGVVVVVVVVVLVVLFGG